MTLTTILPLQASKIVYRYYIMNQNQVHDLATILPLQASKIVYRYFTTNSNIFK